MAENLTAMEIEEGIKKLISLGPSSTQTGGQKADKKDGGPSNPSPDQKGNHKSPENPELAKSPREGGKRNKNKRKKAKEKKTENDGQDNSHSHEQGKQKQHAQKQHDGKGKQGGKPRDERKHSPQVKDDGVLKPGMIITVNKDSKRSIVSCIAENKDSKPAVKDKEKKSQNSDLVTIDATGKVVDEHSKTDDLVKKLKKRRKKGKKASVESSDDDDDDENGKESHDHDQKIAEASKKFWNMKQGEKTHRAKHEKSGHEADDEKGQHEDLNLDISDLDDDISTDILLQVLERDRIFPLKKRSIRFPRARFFCRVCDYHMDTVDDVRRHGKDHRHQRRVENIKVQDELKKMTSPTEEQITALDKLLEETYQSQHLTEALLQERNDVVSNLENFLKKILPDVKLQIFGSTLTGLGLVSSDVNVDLEVEKDHAKCLTIVFKAMKESDEYQNVISDFTSKVPCIYFTVKDVQYRITISSDTARNTSHLLQLYGICDPRFVKLAVVFRYWAKVCKIDRQDEGTLPAYSFYLLLVFYLQRCKPPVLPLLYQGSDDLGSTSPTKMKPAVKAEVDFDEISELAREWRSENTESIGSLWLEMFKYYVLGFEMNSHVVCIRQLGICTRAQKKWNSKKLAIEDPFALKRNVTKSVAGFELFEYIWDCVRKAYRYFGQPTNVKEIKHKRKKKHSSHHSPSNQFLNVTNTPVKNVGNLECSEKVLADLNKGESQELTSCKDESADLLENSKKDVAAKSVEKNENVKGEDASKIDQKPCENLEAHEKSNICDSENTSQTDFQIVKEASKIVSSLINYVIATASSLTSTTNTQERWSHQEKKLDTITSNSYKTAVSDCCRLAAKTSDLKHDSDCPNIDDTDQKQGGIEATKSSQTLNFFARYIVESAIEGAMSKLTSEQLKTDESDVTNLSKSDILVPEYDGKQLQPWMCVAYVRGDSIMSPSISFSRPQGKRSNSISDDIGVKKIPVVDNLASEGQRQRSLSESDTKENSKEIIDLTSLEKPVENSIENDHTIDTLAPCSTLAGEEQSDIPDSSNEEVKVKVEEKEEENTAQYNYMFQYTVLTDGKGPAVYCSLCEKEGHLKNSCPEEKLPDLIPLPKLSKSHKDMLSILLKRMPSGFGPTDNELREREMIRFELEEFIQELYPDCRVHLFGSSHNGFGFSQSDLDLCVTFDMHPTGEGLDMVHFIECISGKLKTHRGLYNVFPITTAKVPIVKFKHRRSQLEGDISMYNLLALQNTQMVRMYAALDQRVRILGIALKVFVKACDIGDASRGSLSSYAYILMLIHYLQQCKPPVVPVLQDLYHHYGPEKPELMIDGWNAWYFDNMKSLPDIWLDYGKNNQSAGELWLGFFRYYTEEFNMKEQVVCCRQTALLTKFEKLWNSPCIAIEDPFDLNHNLGGGLSRKMHQFIHKALIRGRALYGNPRPDLSTEWKILYGYFFAPERLNEGPAPNDRCCRACNKIGHIAKECPVVKNRKEREEKEKKKRANQKSKEGEHGRNQPDNANNSNGRADQSQRDTRDRVIHRTISESHDMRYHQSQPMSIPQSRQQTHRSMSLPSSYHGQYSPMSSPQGYQGYSHNRSPLQHNMSQQPYSQGSQNSGVTRSLFNQQQFRSSPGRSSGSHHIPVSHQHGHQVPVSHQQSPGRAGHQVPISNQPFFVYAPVQQQHTSVGIGQGFLLPVQLFNPVRYPNVSEHVGLGMTNINVASRPFHMARDAQSCMESDVNKAPKTEHQP